MRANIALSTLLTALLLAAQTDALVIPTSSTGASVPSVVLLLRSESEAGAMVTKRSFGNDNDRHLLRRAVIIPISDDGPASALAPRALGGALAWIVAQGAANYGVKCWFTKFSSKTCIGHKSHQDQ